TFPRGSNRIAPFCSARWYCFAGFFWRSSSESSCMAAHYRVRVKTWIRRPPQQLNRATPSARADAGAAFQRRLKCSELSVPLSRLSIHGGWRNQWTFIAAVTGASIGLGNLWKFAYLAGVNGGAGFVLMYLFFVALVATPLLVAEVVIGARGRSDPVHALESIVLESALNRQWRWVGWMGVIAALLILSYLSVIAGWLMAYCRWVFEGHLAAASARQVGELFG